MNELIVSQIEELKACFVEGQFAVNKALIDTYHQAGKIIMDMGDVSVQDLAPKVGRSERTLHYAIKLYTMFPDMDMLPEGKNMTMNFLIRKYLTTPKEQKDHDHNWIEICSGCKIRK